MSWIMVEVDNAAIDCKSFAGKDARIFGVSVKTITAV
jgi:hypothetical protein